MPYMTQKAIARQLDDEIENALNSETISNPQDAEEQQYASEQEANTQSNEVPDENYGEVPAEEVPEEDADAEEQPELPEDDQPADAIQEPIQTKEVSTTYLNDNYRNEHLYDMCIKLKELCEKYKFIFSEMSKDEITEKQFKFLQNENHEITKLINSINTFNRDYFADRLYNENLITYLHLRSALIASIRRFKDMFRV